MSDTSPTLQLPAGLDIPKGIPIKMQFATPAEARLHRKQMLAASFRLFSKFGYDEGVAGHITARDPEQTDCFWVNPFGIDFGSIKTSDLICVNHKGEVIEGRYSVNRAAFAIHSQVHAARPDVVAAAHSHAMHGKAFATLGRRLAPITQDACAFYEDHGLFNDFTGVVNDTDEGQRIAAALGKTKACILQNHGLLTVGHTVEEAVWWFITMDRSCQAQLLAEATGHKPIEIDHQNAILTRGQVGSMIAGYFQFQPLLQRITKEQPDYLD
jgi:ribulose-5-phosphate 4-epimerase/fuculose-1-phosphate aldolase